MQTSLTQNTPLVIALCIAALVIASLIGIFLAVVQPTEMLIGF